MQKFLGAVCVFSLTAVAGFAAGIPTNKTIYGDYMEARNADVYTGPCFANAEVGLMGELAVFGWRVKQGTWDGVNLAGLSVVGVVRAAHTLGDAYETSYPVKSVLIVDERATAEQRLALQKFAKRMGGDLFQEVLKVEYRPIQIGFENNDMHSMRAKLVAGELAKIETRALSENDHICRNEEVWYQPLAKLNHAMPAYSLANAYQGDGLGTRWSNPGQRSAFIGTFSQPSE